MYPSLPRRKDNILFKIFGTAIVLLVMSLPLDLYIGVRAFANPEGFWQEFALGAVAVYVLGGFQFIFLLIGVFILFALWLDNI